MKAYGAKRKRWWCGCDRHLTSEPKSRKRERQQAKRDISKGRAV